MRLFTIGFTQKAAEEFFEALKSAGVKRVVDIRLNNTSQLAGFTKKNDLKYFLKVIGNIDYIHLAELAPTKALVDGFKKEKGSWERYKEGYLSLLLERKIDKAFFMRMLKSDDCLLCSEATADQCHRRLVAEYFQDKCGNVEIIHLT